MFRSSCRLLQAQAIQPEAFRHSLAQLWQANHRPPPRRVGLAISGGVDSMALAWLCSAMSRRDRRAYEFTAFVVDHKLRKGSTKEASQVSKALTRMGLHSRILTLDWQGDRPRDDMESAARRLRYRSLGQACYKARISSLWFAHHADDQAETVLMRIANGYLGAGLAGMRTISQIPECEGMYGVQQSGSPRRVLPGNSQGSRMWTEAGGVSTVRPMLSYSKAELIATCEGAGVRWFEDETNTDPAITLRNTVRLVHGTNVLPEALRRPRLRAVSELAQQRSDIHYDEADKIFRKLDPILDTRIGTVQCYFPSGSFEGQSTEIDKTYVQAKAVRKLVLIASPSATMLLSDMAKVSSTLFAEHSTTSAPLKVPVAGVLIVGEANPAGGITLKIERAPPKITQAGNRMEVEIPGKGAQRPYSIPWSTWHLWDNRFWLRLGRGSATESSPQVCIRFLTRADIESVRKSLDNNARREINKVLECAKGHTRLTLPAIFCSETPNNGQSVAVYERLIALPSLNWSRDGWQRLKPGAEEPRWLYEIRYRHVDESLTKPFPQPTDREITEVLNS